MKRSPRRQTRPTGVFSFMKRKIRRRAFFALCLLAALLLVAPVTGEKTLAAEPVRLPVVMYHQLSPSGQRAGDYVLPLAQFEADLQYLRAQGYESVGVQRLLDWTAGRCDLPEKPCMITFDDAYETTGACAAPLLARYGFTAVTAVIGSVAEQYTASPDDTLAYAHLSWPELAELASSGVMELQYHSWDMHQLSPRRGCSRMRGESDAAYRAALEKDLERFRAAAADCGVPLVPGAAYPFGAYGPDTEAVLRENGVRVTFSCAEKVNVLTGEAAELFSLGRFNRASGKSSAAFFKAWEE